MKHVGTSAACRHELNSKHSLAMVGSFNMAKSDIGMPSSPGALFLLHLVMATSSSFVVNSAFSSVSIRSYFGQRREASGGGTTLSNLHRLPLAK